jgi:glycine C-acetyltransferase
MLGEAQNLIEMRKVVDEYDDKYPEGVWLIVDDSHGVGVYGLTGRGVEEKCGVRSDILIGTFGKSFGSDGGYVVGDSTVVEYLREASSTYIYSNPVSPGTAAASLQGLAIVDSDDGKGLLEYSRKLISLFMSQAEKLHIPLAAESDHPIQPVLIADTRRTLEIKQKLFDEHLLVTNINYPVVPKGKDEIRIQLSAPHSEEDIMRLAKSISKNL